MILLEQIDKAISAVNVFNLLDGRDAKYREKKYLFLSSFFYRLGITPNFLTLISLLLVILAGSFILYKQIPQAVVAFLFSWFFGFFDGIYARHTASESRFGSIFNGTVNMTCELFLLVPILMDNINTSSYFIVNVLLALLALRILMIVLQAQLRLVKAKTSAVFFGRAGFYWIILLGLLTGQLPLAIVISTVFLAVSFVQLLIRSYYLVYLVSSRPQLKSPIKPKKNIIVPSPKKKKKVKK